MALVILHLPKEEAESHALIDQLNQTNFEFSLTTAPDDFMEAAKYFEKRLREDWTETTASTPLFADILHDDTKPPKEIIVKEEPPDEDYARAENMVPRLRGGGQTEDQVNFLIDSSLRQEAAPVAPLEEKVAEADEVNGVFDQMLENGNGRQKKTSRGRQKQRKLRHVKREFRDEDDDDYWPYAPEPRRSSRPPAPRQFYGVKKDKKKQRRLRHIKRETRDEDYYHSSMVPKRRRSSRTCVIDDDSEDGLMVDVKPFKKKASERANLRVKVDPDAPLDSGSTTIEYEVERVVDVQLKDGQIEYHLKWKNYSMEHNTWEPVYNINCWDLVEDFIRERKAAGLPVAEDLIRQDERARREMEEKPVVKGAFTGSRDEVRYKRHSSRAHSRPKFYGIPDDYEEEGIQKQVDRENFATSKAKFRTKIMRPLIEGIAAVFQPARVKEKGNQGKLRHIKREIRDEDDDISMVPKRRCSSRTYFIDDDSEDDLMVDIKPFKKKATERAHLHVKVEMESDDQESGSATARHGKVAPWLNQLIGLDEGNGVAAQSIGGGSGGEEVIVAGNQNQGVNLRVKAEIDAYSDDQPDRTKKAPECPVAGCDANFTIDLVDHMALHSIPFACRLCPYQSTFAASLRAHYRSHFEKLVCDSCHLTVSCAQQLEAHQCTQREEIAVQMDPLYSNEDDGEGFAKWKQIRGSRWSTSERTPEKKAFHHT